MRIGEYIKNERLANGWSMDELARRSGVSKTHISNIENGHSDLTLGALQLLAGAFDVAAGDMLVSAGYTLKYRDGCPMCGYKGVAAE